MVKVSQRVYLKGYKYNNRFNNYLYINRRLNKGLINNSSYRLAKRSLTSLDRL
jgi:hypothetical protein